MVKKKKKKISNFGILPEELMTEVLVRLPVKTLVVCKSVSKPWLSLVTKSSFVKSHLQYVINNTNNPTLLDILDPSTVNPNILLHDAPKVVLFNRDIQDIEALFLSIQRKLYVIEAFIGGNLHALFSWPVRVVMPRVFGNSRVVGTTCSGIICLIDDYRGVVYLWNPSIKQFKEVSVPESYASGSSSVQIGFGYDSTSNDYKVFRTSYENILDSVPLKMQVYSANADCWREFQGPVLGNKLDEDEEDGFQRNYFIVVNGTVYFSNGDKQQLITFDLHNEVFGLVSFPSVVQRKWSDVMDFKGSVAMVFESLSGVDLWTLDDDVSRQMSSWTKMFSIEADPELKMWLSCYLGAGQFYGTMLRNGNIFVYDVLFDCEKKETVDLEMTTVLQLSNTRRLLFHLTGFIKWRKMPTHSASLKKQSRGYLTLTSIHASEV